MRFLGERPIRQTVAAFLLAILVASPQALAERRTEWTFAGRVVPRQTVEVANRINGVVHSIHVVSGQRVGQGDLLVSLDDADARIDLKVAEAELAEARARLDLANDLARRQRELASRGTAPEARAVERSLEAAIAAAVVSRAEARLRLARLALSRTEVRAPIDGTIGQLKVATGAFVEAEGGTVLLELVQLDPALVAYSVPYADRMDAMAAAGAASVAGLLARLRLTLRLPNGRNHPHAGRALFESSRIDPNTQALTVWGAFPNADRTLLPGLAVQVVSRFAAGSQAGEKR
jgi:membrane fusion protein (multidrug efflux system)